MTTGHSFETYEFGVQKEPMPCRHTPLLVQLWVLLDVIADHLEDGDDALGLAGLAAVGGLYYRI